jgi:hypothetical protein
MRLYAKVKSERAEKGQGGNKYLVTDYLIDDRTRPVLCTRLEIIDGEHYYLRLTDLVSNKILYAEKRKIKAISKKAR